MKHSDFHRRLREVFVVALDDSSFAMDSSIRMGEYPEWDSFNHINLMLGIESEFGVEFDSEEIGTLLSVGEITTALEQRLSLVE
jgi:acyl carrier protein